MIDEMTKKFGDQVLGVHGQELPKFEGEKDQFYWTNYKGYNPTPKIQSQNLLQQTNKYWAVDDQIKISDGTTDPAPILPFKAGEYYKQKSKFLISEKV